MHERNSSSMAWALKNDTEETAEYNSRDGRRWPGEVPRKKKLKALGLTKNAPRERVRSLVRPVRSSQKYILQ